MSRVPPGGAVPVRRSRDIESLLSDLGPRLNLGSQLQIKRSAAQEARAPLPVGRPPVDRLLGGGFPRGSLSEVCGSASSGRTTLALSLLAATTSKGELAGWVDGADAFDPPSAERLGVDLDRVLWVRAPSWREALGATERLVQTEGFPLVFLDGLDGLGGAQPASSWIRLARLAASSHTALLLLSTSRLAGAHAELAVEMQPTRARFSGTPSLLEELETRMVLVRNRAAPVDPDASFEIQLHRTNPSPHESAA